MKISKQKRVIEFIIKNNNLINIFYTETKQSQLDFHIEEKVNIIQDYNFLQRSMSFQIEFKLITKMLLKNFILLVPSTTKVN